MQFELKAIFNTKPSVVYHAWLNGVEHSKMTGAKAVCGDKNGDIFSAWDGYITGKNTALVKDKEIRQNWRTTEFSDKDPDSVVVIKLKQIKNGCELTLIHSNIPVGQTGYKKVGKIFISSQ